MWYEFYDIGWVGLVLGWIRVRNKLYDVDDLLFEYWDIDFSVGMYDVIVGCDWK